MSYPLLPHRLTRLRHDRNLSREELAAATGLTYPTIARCEDGKRELTGEQLAALAKFFKLSPEDVAGRAGKFLVVQGDVRVGLSVHIGHHVVLDAHPPVPSEPVYILVGDQTVIGDMVSITASAFTESRQWLTGSVRIGRGCVIGVGATILPNVELKDGTVVYPGTTVGLDGILE